MERTPEQLHPPAVGRVLTHPTIRPLVARYGHSLVSRVVRDEIRALRSKGSADSPKLEEVVRSAAARIGRLAAPALVRVLNATGVVIHTNLGRAPMGGASARRVAEIAEGYSNLEFDLGRGRRGNRQSRLRELLSRITGAEDALAVNNNAAAIFLLLRNFAFRKEVIVSRGELIEIGDSFRLPEIMREAGARLVEVGTTNRTRISDYEAAITERTAMLFKAHRSNFEMRGFTEEASTEELAGLARARGLIAVYDLGSGLLRRVRGVPLAGEPTVEEAIAAGADLVTFSGDKLLGSAQAGLIAGRGDLVAKLAKAPLMRALRPGKLTIAAIEQLALQYLDRSTLIEESPVFRMIARGSDELRAAAEKLATRLREGGVSVDVVPSSGQVGGGALPGLELPGWAVEIAPPTQSARAGKRYAENLFAALLRGDPPVLGVLREGKLLLDVRTLGEDESEMAAGAVGAAIRAITP